MLALAEFVFLAVHLADHLAVLTLEALGVDEAQPALGVVRQASHLWEPWCVPAHEFERLDWRVLLVVAAVVHADGDRPQDPEEDLDHERVGEQTAHRLLHNPGAVAKAEQQCQECEALHH